MDHQPDVCMLSIKSSINKSINRRALSAQGWSVFVPNQPRDGEGGFGANLLTEGWATEFWRSGCGFRGAVTFCRRGRWLKSWGSLQIPHPERVWVFCAGNGAGTQR